MDLKNFLESDQLSAYKEAVCVTNCLFTMKSAFLKDDYKQARTAAEHVVRSLKSLEEMQNRKEHQERLQDLLDEMQAQGISIAILKRWEIKDDTTG